MTKMALEGWQAVQWDSGCGDGLFITILYHSKRFHISLLPPSTPNTIEGTLISKFDSIDDEDEDEVLATQKEIEDIVYEAGRSIWTELAPLLPDRQYPSDLHSLLYPETFSFHFITINGEAVLMPVETDDARYHDHFGMKIDNDLGLPEYSSKDIDVLETFIGQGCITRVSAGGREMCCKSGDDAFWPGIEREFHCLRKITKSHLAWSLGVPRLLGLVISAETGMVIGILEEYIPTGVLSNLREIEDEGMDVSRERRRKWGAQIRETVDLLHEIGVIWGDGKPHNVLIHKETDDAWVIHFGGSYTEGWVDEELMETIAGDEQAVGKILDFLHV